MVEDEGRQPCNVRRRDLITTLTQLLQSQYVSANFRALLAANECRQSMSRRGNCWDNAQAESLCSRYKAELLEGGAFENIEQARIETFS